MQVRLGLRRGHTPLEASEQMNIANAFHDPSTFENDRQVNVRSAPHESLGHHTDYGSNFVVQAKLPAHHGWIASKLSLPETIAQDCHRFSFRRSVGRNNRPSEQRRNTHHLKRVRRAEVSPQPLRIASPGPEDVADS